MKQNFMLPPKIHKNKKGFTLLEILIVIAVLSLLAMIVSISIRKVITNVRDAKRVADLNQIRKGLELFYINTGAYPNCDCAPNCWDNPPADEMWNCMIDDLRSQGVIADADYGIKGSGLLDRFIAMIVPNAKANMDILYLQDPLYGNTYSVGATKGPFAAGYPYRYEYNPGNKSDNDNNDWQNFRIRARLENLNSTYFKNTLEGQFWYSDPDNKDDWYECRSYLGYYCLGPKNNYSAYHAGKPVIYLYPEKEQEVEVMVYPKKITKSDPIYKNGWRIIASPNGTLYNLDTKKIYPYLFWEGKTDNPIIDRNRGFVVKKDEVDNFLNSKLQALGLNQKEAADFVEFWEPKLQKKPYVYIYFMPQSDFDKLVPLKISPQPDTIIRVYMLYKSLNRPIKAQEQKIITPQRKGFTVIEWGGNLMEIK